MHGIGSGPLLRLDRRLRPDTARRDTLDWLRSGGRVLLRNPDAVDFAEDVRQDLTAIGEERQLLVVFGERSIVLTLTSAGDDADAPSSRVTAAAGSPAGSRRRSRERIPGT